MAEESQRPLHTVLDRILLDDGRATPEATMDECVAFVCRDLEWLLNDTRPVERLALEAFPELSRSILNYGLPDVVSVSLGSRPECERLARALRTCVRAFEPRLKNIEVTLTSQGEGVPTLRFRVDGVLDLPPSPRRVSFDTTYDLRNRKYAVGS